MDTNGPTFGFGFYYKQQKLFIIFSVNDFIQ
jgi:hypothetical protein